MYKKMTNKEKRKYLKESILSKILISILLAMLMTIIINCLFNLNIHYIIIFVISFILVLIFQLLFPVNYFSKKIQITDGYIDKIKDYKNNDSNQIYARAVTKDGTKTTKYRGIPLMFKSGKAPVKILIYKNKAYDFFITNESYDYIKSKNKDNKIINFIGIIIGIIIVILLLILIIN